MLSIHITLKTKYIVHNSQNYTSLSLTCLAPAPRVCWRVAMCLRLWLGTTLSSWSAVTRSRAGY